jgi:cytochrome c556
MKLAATFAASGAALLLATAASAQSFQKPEDAIKYRRSAMTLMGAHMGVLGAMANGRVPFDAQVASRNADVLALVTQLQFAGFVPGSDKGETRAKPEIWTESAKFKAAAEKTQDAVAKLAAAAKSGNLDTMKAAFGPAAQSCKACHDDFRKE